MFSRPNFLLSTAGAALSASTTASTRPAFAIDEKLCPLVVKDSHRLLANNMQRESIEHRIDADEMNAQRS